MYIYIYIYIYIYSKPKPNFIRFGRFARFIRFTRFSRWMHKIIKIQQNASTSRENHSKSIKINEIPSTSSNIFKKHTKSHNK